MTWPSGLFLDDRYSPVRYSAGATRLAAHRGCSGLLVQLRVLARCVGATGREARILVHLALRALHHRHLRALREGDGGRAD